MWELWHKELAERDLDPKTRDRYWQVAEAYRSWLNGRPPDVATAREYLSSLRERGYSQRSILLYYHALRLALAFWGQDLKLKLRKPRDLPRYCDAADVERLIAQAERGLPRHTLEVRQRNVAIIVTLAFASVRRQELLNLRLSDVDFERRTISVRGGKGEEPAEIGEEHCDAYAQADPEDHATWKLPQPCAKVSQDLAHELGVLAGLRVLLEDVEHVIGLIHIRDDVLCGIRQVGTVPRDASPEGLKLASGAAEEFPNRPILAANPERWGYGLLAAHRRSSPAPCDFRIYPTLSS